MKKVAGIYLSGTGNSKHSIEKLLSLLDPEAKAYAIEDPQALQAIEQNDLIILAYGVHYSNVPMMVKDYIKKHASLWNGKEVICMATMGLFSGDGAGCCARVLRKCGAHVVGGIHLKMPDSVCDVKALKRPRETNRMLIQKADQKIERVAKLIQAGKCTRNGLHLYEHIGGLFGQRLWFLSKSAHYSNQLKVSEACVGCGLCASNCPMHNLKMIDHKPQQKGNCTMCYRCISHCPKQAITLLGKNVVEQVQFEKYQ